jgi:hypothetical protein
MNKFKSFFCKNNDKIDKLPASLIKKKGGKNTNTPGNGKCEITTEKRNIK